MKQIFLLDGEAQLTAKQVGGKAMALVSLFRAGARLPKTVFLTTAAYKKFLKINGLREKIQMELNAKEFSDMRWEEIWDISLRIRQLFLTTKFPESLGSMIHQFVGDSFGDVPLAVRSSATEEDGARASFAGLHESYLNIRSPEQLEVAIRKVWASLWSDKALLYRQELQLAVGSSGMAIVVQELLPSTVAGIGFTHDPTDSDCMVVEAVHGLNQGLVDGDVDPDRYQMSRKDRRLVAHTAPETRDRYAVADHSDGVEITALPLDKRDKPPLMSRELVDLVETMARLEKWFASPLDIEWCLANDLLYILQARPITAGIGERSDRRAWYLSLHRSFSNLLELWQRIEQGMLPEMESEFREMAAVDLATLTREELAQHIRQRFQRVSFWSKRYWDDCIPFAHGIRLFGEIFNEVMAPTDPYQFVTLLSGEEMLSTRRNSLLRKLAGRLRNNPDIKKQYATGGLAAIEDAEFVEEFKEVEYQFGNFFINQQTGSSASRDNLLKVIFEYGNLEDKPRPESMKMRLGLERQFLQNLTNSRLSIDGEELLSLARASYRLRDDDNIYMGKIEQQLVLALEEGRRRLLVVERDELLATPEEVAELLVGKEVEPVSSAQSERQQKAPKKKAAAAKVSQPAVRGRQLPGQPASRGFCRGVARVIERPEQMTEFKAGEVLVVDSIDPNMTFLAPLAAGIVERRGGMLIHGAIIAREYGIPCVTGVAGVTSYIRTGDMVTVDGYLGLVIVDSKA